MGSCGLSKRFNNEDNVVRGLNISSLESQNKKVYFSVNNKER